MSHEYKIEVEVPVEKGCETHWKSVDIRSVLADWGFDPDGEDLVADKVLQFWGYRSLSGKTPDESHAELVEKLPGAVTRWRCVEYDEWDDTFGEKESVPSVG